MQSRELQAASALEKQKCETKTDIQGECDPQHNSTGVVIKDNCSESAMAAKGVAGLNSNGLFTAQQYRGALRRLLLEPILPPPGQSQTRKAIGQIHLPPVEEFLA